MLSCNILLLSSTSFGYSYQISTTRPRIGLPNQKDQTDAAACRPFITIVSITPSNLWSLRWSISACQVVNVKLVTQIIGLQTSQSRSTLVSAEKASDIADEAF